MRSWKDQLLHNSHWTNPNYKQRVTTEDWKALLLEDGDKIIFRGRLVPLVAKNLGYGVVEISKKIDEQEENVQNKS